MIVCVCCEREEQTNKAMVDGCSMKKDQEKGLQPVGIPAFNLTMAWSSELMLYAICVCEET